MSRLYEGYTLTKDQETFFEKYGFFIMKNVLSDTEIKELLKAIEMIWRKYRSGDSDYLHMFDFFNKNPLFLNLVDHPKILPLILGLLGWNIYMYHAHLDVNSPIARDNAHGLTWHRDNSRMNHDFKGGRYPLVALKTAYWLSDVSEKDRGNLYVIPGSHKWDHSEGETIKKDILPSEAIPILAKSGTVLLFDSRIWHTRSNNLSQVTRKVLFLGYSYRWLRPRDDAKISPRLLKKASPIQRQLLTRNMGSDAYVPKDENVPLRALYYKLYPSVSLATAGDF